MILSENRSGDGSLYIYSVQREDFGAPMRDALGALMRGKVRDWLLATRRRPETAVFGSEKLLVEWVNRDRRLHQMRWR